MRPFKKFVNETNAAGAGGVFGAAAGADASVFSSDSYAPGDTRVPKVLGMYSRKGKIKKKKKKKNI